MRPQWSNETSKTLDRTAPFSFPWQRVDHSTRTRLGCRKGFVIIVNLLFLIFAKLLWYDLNTDSIHELNKMSMNKFAGRDLELYIMLSTNPSFVLRKVTSVMEQFVLGYRVIWTPKLPNYCHTKWYKNNSSYWDFKWLYSNCSTFRKELTCVQFRARQSTRRKPPGHTCKEVSHSEKGMMGPTSVLVLEHTPLMYYPLQVEKTEKLYLWYSYKINTCHLMASAWYEKFCSKALEFSRHSVNILYLIVYGGSRGYEVHIIFHCPSCLNDRKCLSDHRHFCIIFRLL